ncbi:phasin family protein [Propionivibrio sp.]|uniref:phasin family protein n=1 Tax=Propionivibrio sp. TaxID=2212460 RepID=UPI003BF212B6
MITTPEKFVAANKAVVDSLLSLANTALSSAERIAALNLNTARSILEDGVANAKALISAKDPQEAFKLSVAQAQPVVEQVVAYSRSLYEISAHSKEDISKLLESQFSDFQQQVSSLIATAAKNAPVGSDVAVAAVKSALEAANSSFGNMRNMVKQATEIAEANIVKASNAATSFGKK